MGSATTDHTARRRLRQRLVAEGADPATVEAAVAAKALEQNRRRGQPDTPPKRARRSSTRTYGAYQPVRHDEPETTQPEPWRPDDRGFVPAPPDPLLAGAGRVTGIAAKAVRRRKALTRYEYDRLAERA